MRSSVPVEGIESFSVDVAHDLAGTDPASFTIAYDAIAEADPAHQFVMRRAGLAPSPAGRSSMG